MYDDQPSPKDWSLSLRLGLDKPKGNNASQNAFSAQARGLVSCISDIWKSRTSLYEKSEPCPQGNTPKEIDDT